MNPFDILSVNVDSKTLDGYRLVIHLGYENEESFEVHHILPRSIYPEYSNLSEHPWNSVQLSPKNHLIAHYLLSKMFGGSMSQAYHMMCSFKKYEGFPTDDMIVEYESAKDVHREKSRSAARELHARPGHTDTVINAMHSAITPEGKRRAELKKIEDGTHNFQINSEKIRFVNSTKMKDNWLNDTFREKVSSAVSRRNLIDNPGKTDRARQASSDRGRERMSDPSLNPSKKPENIELARQRKAQYWKEAPIGTCPHCGFQSKSLKRYHMDNCKERPKD